MKELFKSMLQIQRRLNLHGSQFRSIGDDVISSTQLSASTFKLFIKRIDENKYSIFTKTFFNKLSVKEISVKEDENIFDFFKDRRKLNEKDKNFYFKGLNDRYFSVFSLSDKDLSLFLRDASSTGEPSFIFIDSISLSNIEDVEYLDGSIVFKERTSGEELLIDGLKKSNAIFLYRALKKRSTKVIF